MNKTKAMVEYLEWINKGMLGLQITEHLSGGAFTCSIYKTNEYISDVMTPVLSLSNLNIASYKPGSPALEEFLDFLEFVEKHNARTAIILVEVSMHLFFLVDESHDYITVDAVMDGKNSKITIWKATTRS